MRSRPGRITQQSLSQHEVAGLGLEVTDLGDTGGEGDWGGVEVPRRGGGDKAQWDGAIQPPQPMVPQPSQPLGCEPSRPRAWGQVVRHFCIETSI